MHVTQKPIDARADLILIPCAYRPEPSSLPAFSRTQRALPISLSLLYLYLYFYLYLYLSVSILVFIP
jgi:hypothetical protein